MNKFIFLALIFSVSFASNNCKEVNCIPDKVEGNEVYVIDRLPLPVKLNVFQDKKVKPGLIKTIDDLKKNTTNMDLKKMGTGAHGGDPESLEFALIGRSIIHKIKNGGEYLFSEFNIAEFEEVVNNSYIKGLEFADTNEAQELRRNYFNLHNDHEVKCALNYFDIQTIEIDRACFRNITDYNVKETLVFHEYLGLLGLEWDQSFISSRLMQLNRNGRMISRRKILTVRNSVDEVFNTIENERIDILKEIKEYASFTCKEVSALNQQYYINSDLYNFYGISNSLPSNYSAKEYKYSDQRKSFVGNFNIGTENYIDVIKVRNKKIYSKVFLLKDGKEINVLSRKCSGLKSELRSLLTYTIHLVKEYFKYNNRESNLLPDINKVLSSKNYKKCYGRADHLDKDFLPVIYRSEHINSKKKHQKIMRNTLNTDGYSRISCFRAFKEFQEAFNFYVEDEENKLEDLNTYLVKLRDLGESYTDPEDKKLIDKVFNETLRVIQNAQNFLFQSVEIMYDKYTCPKRLKQKYRLECHIKTTIYGNYNLAPKVREFHGPLVFEQLSDILSSI